MNRTIQGKNAVVKKEDRKDKAIEERKK